MMYIIKINGFHDKTWWKKCSKVGLLEQDARDRDKEKRREGVSSWRDKSVTPRNRENADFI